MARLSTLVASVLGDTTVGVTDAERRAAATRQEVRTLLDGPVEDLVEDATVERELARVAPSLDDPPETVLRGALPAEQVARYVESWSPGTTAVRPGEVYLHSRFVDAPDGQDATPFEGLEREFDVEVDPADLAFRGGVPFLTATAADRIRAAVKRSLGCRRREALRRMADEGFPRPVVEHVDVDVKLSFDGLRSVRTVDATAVDDVVPEAVGGVAARVHFESGEVR